MSGELQSPTVILSVDFELRWGLHDRYGAAVDAQGQHLSNARQVVPKLIQLLSERGLHATWACVGALGCRDWDEYFLRAPRAPRYQDPTLAFRPEYADLDPRGELHFAPELLEMIHAAPGQELGTHTFSHLLCREPGIVEEDLRADLEAVTQLWQERYGAPPRSLAFPRNQSAFLALIRSSTIRIWRGNPTPWYHDCHDAASNRLVARMCRVADGMNPLAKGTTALQGDMVRSSLFLRVAWPDLAWRLHLSRIQREIASLGPGQIFHLWWHPHNFGVDTAVRLSRLEQVLDCIAERQARGELVSRSMGEMVV